MPRAEECGDRWAAGMGYVLWGEALWRLGDYALAQNRLAHAQEIADALADAPATATAGVRLVGWVHHHLGIIDDIQGRYDEALKHLAQACNAWRAIENLQALSGTLNSIGLVYYHLGNLSAAQRAMEEALTLCNQLDDRHRQSTLLNNLSMITTDQSDYLSAQHYLRLGLALATENGNLTSQGEIYSNLGKNYRLLGNTRLAIESLEKGLQISESIGNRVLKATIMLDLAEASSIAAPRRAARLYHQALQIAQQYSLQHIECEVLIGMAELCKSNAKEAKQYSAQAVALAEAVRNPDLLERAISIDHFFDIAAGKDDTLSM